jgi:energy-coupling factor transporter transmembrane protein EcfT
MTLGYIFYSICAIIIISLIIILTTMIKGTRALKKLLIIIVPITILLVFYFWNYNFNLFIKSKVFPQHTYTVSYLNSRKIDIPLPTNSVWLFKTPTDIYYSKHNVNKCREFFDSVLTDMKQNNKIRKYSYNKEQKIYTIEIDGGVNISINLIGDSDARRYGIFNPNY